MRLIPGKTKVQIELFKGVSLWDILVGAIALIMIILVLISSLPWKIAIISVLIFVAGLLLMRLDTQPNYMMIIHMFQHIGLPRHYRRVYTDEQLIKKASGKIVEDYIEEYREENKAENAEYEENGYEIDYDDEDEDEEADDYGLRYSDEDLKYSDTDDGEFGKEDKKSEKKGFSLFAKKKTKDAEEGKDNNKDAASVKKKKSDTVIRVDKASLRAAKKDEEDFSFDDTDDADTDEMDEEALSISELNRLDRELRKEENKILKSRTATEAEKDAVWLARANRSAAKKKARAAAKSEISDSVFSASFMEDIIAFTGIKDGYIEYGGKYYGSVIEISPVEFRFYSKHRRKNSIENGLGRVLRSVHAGYAANILKIERPIIYDAYLEKEEKKLEEIRKSYESGMMSEEEFRGRVEIVKDRIDDLKNMCFNKKVINSFFYLILFESDLKQLDIMTKSAMDSLTAGEILARRLTDDKVVVVFLKYTNQIDFDERDIEKIAPEDYAQWAMPNSLNFKFRTIEVNNIITHNLRVVTYPTMVGDAWLAGVMSIPGTKVMVKCTPMDRAKSVRTIDHSLSELRGQYNATGVDSKRIELETHIASLSELLATLQGEGEELMECNIYITIYDIQQTRSTPSIEQPPRSDLPVVNAMKKNVRRSWQESNFRLNNMEFEQLTAFIGSQVSAYDPKEKDGRGIPTNSIGACFPWIYAHISDEGGFKLGSSDGIPVFINFFRRDNERVNSNMVVIGKSGSGKSYATKSLLSNLAAEDAKIFILDPENEYSELARNLHGKVINVANAQYGRLNPFNIITALDDDEEGGGVTGSFSTHLQFLEEFYRQILPEIDKDALEYLNTLTERLYTNKGITPETDLSALRPEDYPIFDDLYDAVLAEFERTDNEYIRSLLRSLVNYVSKFATGGRNSNIWNGPSTVTTDENFTVFNFQSMLSNRNTTIANAQMLLVLKYIDNEIIKNRDYNTRYKLNRKIVVVIDEAHVFIDEKYPVALDFMFQLAKRIRKYNGMQIVITQNIKDFVGSEEIARKSTAIINACQYSFIFALAPNDIQDLCKLYEKAGGINTLEQEQITQAPRGQAFTVMSPTSRSTFRIEVPKNMVDMFQDNDYESKRFAGEEGAELWEDFVGESRELNEESYQANKRSEAVETLIGEEQEKKKRVVFEEVGEEEEPEIFDIGTTARARRKNVRNVTMEEVIETPETEQYVPAMQPAVAPMPYVAATAGTVPAAAGVVVPAMAGMAAASAPSDISGMVESIRSQVLQEVLKELKSSGSFAGEMNSDGVAEEQYYGYGDETDTEDSDNTDELINISRILGFRTEDDEELVDDDESEDEFDFASIMRGAGLYDEETPAGDDEDENYIFGGDNTGNDEDEGSLFAGSLGDDEDEDEDEPGEEDYDSFDFSLLFSGADSGDEDEEGESGDDDDSDFDIMSLLRAEAESYVAEEAIEDVSELVGDNEVVEISLNELAALVKLQREERRKSE